MSEHKEDTCLSTNGDVQEDTNGKNDKTTSTPRERSSAPNAEPSPAEKSIVEPPTGLWVMDGPVLTSGKLRADPTDNKQTRWEKFKDFMLLNRAKPNPMLMNPDAKIVGTFTIYQNGHIEENVAITDDPRARAFQVVAYQITRQTWRASAQPVDKRKPKWWTDKYAALILDFLKAKEVAMRALNERMFAASGSSITLDSQTPQIVKKKGS